MGAAVNAGEVFWSGGQRIYGKYMPSAYFCCELKTFSKKNLLKIGRKISENLVTCIKFFLLKKFRIVHFSASL